MHSNVSSLYLYNKSKNGENSSQRSPSAWTVAIEPWLAWEQRLRETHNYNQAKGHEAPLLSDAADARCSAEGSEGSRHDGYDGLQDESPDVFLFVHIT